MEKKCLYCRDSFKAKYLKQKFCSEKCANRFNLNNLNKVILPEQSVDLAEFIGIFLGDGSLGKHYIGIYLNSVSDRLYISYVKKLCTQLFKGATVTCNKKKNENCTRVQISSVIVARFLTGMRLKPKAIPSWIYNSESYIKACIRGLFDTEGSISFKIYKAKKKISVYKQLNFRNANLDLIKFVRDNLKLFGFKPTMSLKRSLYLSTHESIELFRQLIGFSNSKLSERSLVRDWDDYKRWRSLISNSLI